MPGFSQSLRMNNVSNDKPNQSREAGLKIFLGCASIALNRVMLNCVKAGWLILSGV